MNVQKKILIVDDCIDNLNIFISFFDDSADIYDIYTANNGRIAIKNAAKLLPDLIIMDWQMPDLDGIETIKLLKKDENLKNIPVIVATAAMTTVENLSTALEAGAVDYIKHPIDKIELLARLNSALTIAEYIQQNKLQLEIIHQKEKELLLREAEQARIELEVKQKELSMIAAQLVNITDVNNKIINDLKSLSVYTNDEGLVIINTITKYYKQKANNEHWKAFNTQFNLLNKNFYHNLTQAFPDLTLNEKKLCAYLKLNMSNKDICSISFQSPDSIKKARYRLRKKFNLERKTDLHTFLLQW